jgi:DNA helicase-2/ATP-dependent DNA helicase PcrA
MEPSGILEKLNPFQTEAVLDESPAALVNAAVGSGKTTVLAAKVFHLHENKGVPFSDMVVITFTNKAADEIKERVRASAEDLPWLGTFHSVAMRMLQTALPVQNLGYTASFTLMDPGELLETAESLIAEKKLKIKYINKLDKRFEAFRAGQRLFGAMKKEDDIAPLWELIQTEKKSRNCMDFDDLLTNAALLLQDRDNFAKWVIVDEFQDCDSLQLMFIRSLMGKETRLFAVGDPNQSIYGWRGGKRDIFTEFKKEFSAREFALPLNYRSSSTILEAARYFLQDRSELAGVREPGCGIRVSSHYNAFMEAAALADRIKRLHETGVPWRNIAVFYRLQKQSEALADIFGRKEIPISVSARKTLKDYPALQWLVRLLKASVNPDDSGSRISALSDSRFGCLTRAGAKKAAAGSGCELYDKIMEFQEWAKNAEDAESIIGYFDLAKYLSPTSSQFQENRNLADLFIKRLDRHIRENGTDVLQGTRDFLNSASLYGAEMLEDSSGAGADAVRLMTLHACKGLEFQYVFIIGVNYGIVPLIRAGGGQDAEEEKRLFFVGITRAKDFLELSWLTNPDDPQAMPGESPYISMIPDHLIDRADEPRANSSDLQHIRRALMENRKQTNTPAQDFSAPPPIQEERRKVRHAKYGEGVLESEDENNYVVMFEHFGKKEFSKDFCPLEFLE